MTTHGFPDANGSGYDEQQMKWTVLLWLLGVACDQEATEPPADADGDGYRATDCNDQDPEIFPGATEVCDGQDNDCDGIIDEDVTTAILRYADTDADGYGDALQSQTFCTPPDAGWVDNYTDCDDQDPEINPDADEICDTIDNDCNGLIDDEDEGLARGDWTFDQDLDGFGSDLLPPRCTYTEGYVFEGGDCDDLDPTINPGIAEVCDGIDNDCDGFVDANDDDTVDASFWFPDRDGDGYGDENEGVFSCDDVDEYIETDGDCNDSDDQIHDGAPEWSDGVDNNCNGLIDEQALADAAVRFTGQTGDHMGTAIAGGTDLNGNGHGDLVIGAPGRDAGHVYVYFGGELGDEYTPSDADVIITGAQVGDRAGAALVSADVDGDGHGDLLIGAPNSSADSGQIALFYGPITANMTLSSADVLLSGSGDLAGSALGMGDMDRDGIHDLLIGAPAAEKNTGRVDLLWGDELSDGSLSRRAAASFVGPRGESLAGQQVSTDSDLNGDGYQDMLVGAPYGSLTAFRAGEVYLLYGQGGFSGETEIYSSADMLLFGGDGADQLGASLAGGGDIDGDGYDDVALGAPEDDTENVDGGAICLLYGGATARSGSAAFSSCDAILLGSHYLQRAGQALAMAGDSDGDGRDDLIIGAPLFAVEETVAGSVFWLAGDHFSGTVSIDDNALRLVGENTAGAGTALADIGDTNADDAPDILIGAPDHNDGAGTVYLLNTW